MLAIVHNASFRKEKKVKTNFKDYVSENYTERYLYFEIIEIKWRNICSLNVIIHFFNDICDYT